ncbi:MAG: hypothetical protein N2422_09480 [Rhodobacteraceae bacterium]|nr:hypothetical protein [Paracoccaceae bacterium]
MSGAGFRRRRRPPRAPARAALARAALARAALAWVALAGAAQAHASQQSFVLLLPTDYYIAGGVAAVLLTVVLIAAVPPAAARAVFATLPLARSRRLPGRVATSCASAAVLLLLVLAGFRGTHDPAHNILPVFVWTVFWILLVLAQGLLGDLWSWLNPWSGPLALLRRAGLGPLARLPAGAGHWPALGFLLAFAAVLLVDVAPADPDRLAAMVLAWWGGHLALGLAFGPRWLRRGEALTVLMAAYGRVAPLGAARGRFRLGLWAWKTAGAAPPPAGLAAFMVAMLALGSFDGLYETFFWFSITGENPLEFTGRSAVAGVNLAGLLAATPALAAAYAACLWLGLVLARAPAQAGSGAGPGGAGPGTGDAFRAYAPALLPIALAYHLAHYLPSLLVGIQSVPIVLNDPAGRGWDLFGWGQLQVTTGFFNRLDSVRAIWLAQAGAVVAGHVLAILASHVIALRLHGGHRRAALAQAPLAAFMVLYTLFGLWLLASPRGV